VKSADRYSGIGVTISRRDILHGIGTLEAGAIVWSRNCRACCDPATVRDGLNVTADSSFRIDRPGLGSLSYAAARKTQQGHLYHLI